MSFSTATGVYTNNPKGQNTGIWYENSSRRRSIAELEKTAGEYEEFTNNPRSRAQSRFLANNRMKTLHACAVVALLLMTVLCSVGALLAQQQGQPKPLRFDFTPFAGYRTIMSIPIEPHVSGLNPSILLDAGPSYGASFGYWIREDDLVELRWARQSSNIHSVDVALQPPRQSLVIDQFHGDFSHEYLVEDWAEWARPFVMGSVGATHASGVNNLNFTRFSFGIGGGIRFYPTRHLGFKIQAEWLPVVMDPQVAFVCGPGCVVNVRAALSSQGEVFIGPVLHF